MDERHLERLLPVLLSGLPSFMPALRRAARKASLVRTMTDSGKGHFTILPAVARARADRKEPPGSCFSERSSRLYVRGVPKAPVADSSSIRLERLSALRNESSKSRIMRWFWR